MTSVRPKLKPETPKAITGWDTGTGKTIWMAEDGSWTQDVRQIAAFVGETADQRLAAAMKQESIVTDPYFMEVTETGEITGRETLRETLRAQTIALFAGGDI